MLAAASSIYTGDASGREVARYQPAKLAAIEGVFKTQRTQAPEHLFGWVDADDEKVYGPEIPGLLSWLTYHDVNHPVTGLRAFPKTDWPPANFVFQTFHLMVAIGFGTFFLTGLALFFWWRKTLFQKRWLLWIFVFTIPFVLLANELGWVTAEVGRQPWVVYNIFRTEAGVSPSVHSGEIWASLFLFGGVYLVVGALYVFLLYAKIQRGIDPQQITPEHEHIVTEGHRANVS
jgi:cytochrome d ubiquinol oxidase subunit I